MNNIKYGYALDEHQNVISIHKVTKENRYTHTYHCIECGEEMIARIGEKKVAHFAHKSTSPNCTGETYLHTLAKRLIKEHFVHSDSFIIKYQRYNKCSKYENCPMYDSKKCMDLNRDKDDGSFNLKEFYDTCEEEKKYDDYIADLLLTDTKCPNKNPIFIEIYVTHKSEDKKKNSGNRIIELTIKSEADIEKFISSGIVESPYPEEEKEGFAQFYGFRTFSNITIEGWKCSLPKFYLYQRGNASVKYINCFNAFEKESKLNFECIFFSKDYQEISLERKLVEKYGCILIQSKKANMKFCPLCKYYSNEYPYICMLYKKYHTPKRPQAGYANECKYYREGNEVVIRVRASVKEYDSNSGEIDGIMYKILT